VEEKNQGLESFDKKRMYHMERNSKYWP
jgi:hypothetical protein